MSIEESRDTHQCSAQYARIRTAFPHGMNGFSQVGTINLRAIGCNVRYEFTRKDIEFPCICTITAHEYYQDPSAGRSLTH